MKTIIYLFFTQRPLCALLFFIAVDIWPLSAIADTQARSDPIYRCGKVYQQTPCPDGKAIDTTSALGPFQTPKSTIDRDARQQQAQDEYDRAVWASQPRLAHQDDICPLLKAQLENVISQERQRNTVQALDILRNDHKRLRDDMYRRGC